MEKYIFFHKNLYSMIFGKKEKEVSSIIDEHTVHIEKCLRGFKRGMDSYLSDDICQCESIRDEIMHDEHIADEKKRAVQMKLYEGAFMPLYRDDIYTFSYTYDDIADKAKFNINTLVLEHPHIPSSMSSGFTELVENTISPFENLKKAIVYFRTDREMTIKETQEVERKEHVVDKIEYKLRKTIFENSDLHLAEKLWLRDFVLNVASISDRMEDSASILEIMSVKRQL